MQKIFRGDMTIAEAMQIDSRVSEIFASYHLGGCSHCAISAEETIAQVCMGYGVPIDMLLETLDSLLEDKTNEKSDTEN